MERLKTKIVVKLLLIYEPSAEPLSDSFSIDCTSTYLISNKTITVLKLKKKKKSICIGNVGGVTLTLPILNGI